MKLRDIIACIDGKEVSVDKEVIEQEFSYVFASDLMSDVLAMAIKHSSKMILVTGLANAQAIRTAEMLDIPIIIFVRNKLPRVDELEMAQEKNIAICATSKSMFETCGILYEQGIRGVEIL